MTDPARQTRPTPAPAPVPGNRPATAPDRPFGRVLVANRGEIALRVMRTLHARGIGSVAIHHGAERDAPHALAAGAAVEIEGATPVAAYLDAEQILDAARRNGAEAIHPGYGFLSENAGFARKVAEAGLTFIGPDAGVIELMGDKITARDFARAQGVPVAPSVAPTDDFAAFEAAAVEIGFPLLIKASAGGGGKGMSIVRSPAALREAARIAASEAERYFGDGRIYAELYVERPRHIEVQVLGDGSGAAVHLFERECSIQRRFQKIVEEAPAPGLDPELRARICEAAVRLAGAARYRNAGTVEFILGPDGRFFFLEMNTRLQVEHPVTEMITGLDLVGLQLDIAAGGALPLSQAEVTARGHAIECRICAEVPEADFRPAVGRVELLSLPEAPHLRFDAALARGQTVGADFDPMLAKLIVHGADRDSAIARARAALAETSVLGVETNIDYLARVLSHPAFAAGALHTGFLADHADALRPPAPDAATRAAVLLAAALDQPEFRALIEEVPEPHASIGGWRN